MIQLRVAQGGAMPRGRAPSLRRLPDGSLLQNRLLAALPRAEYDRILQYVRMTAVTTGHTLHAHRARIKDVYFPNGGVFSVTNEMRNGPLVEVATVGREGMLGIGVFFGDRTGIGRTFQQVANGPLPSMTVARFVKETAIAGPFRNVVNLYAQASLLQIMQCTACNALHNVTQRACRWLLQTRDRVEDDTFALKQEFLAVMLGVQRPTVTVVLRALQRDGLISSRYGRIQILHRKRLEAASCECYGVIRAHFARLGL
jgi:CRP-like cAMP-binding protein